MKKKTKCFILTGIFLAGLSVIPPTCAQNIALTDLKSSPSTVSKGEKTIQTNHWAYKTLKDVRQNYGILIGEPGKKFDVNEPITRNEAAILLVNLVGKIEKENIQLSEADRAKLDIVLQELTPEIRTLSGQVQQLESGFKALEGRVSKLENNNKKLWGHAQGEDFKITGGLQSVFYGNFEKGTNGVPSNFSLPYGEIAFSGKLHDHLDFMTKIIPTRNFSDTSTNGLLEDVYVGTDILPHHYLYLGHTAIPFGIEAPMNPLDINFIEFSQISRNLGQGYDTGILAEGDWEFIKYYVGSYNGTGYNSTDNNSRMTVASQVSFLPFYKHEKLGNLEVGGSHISGSNSTNNIDGVGAHISYNKSKFGLTSEYMTLDGITGTNIRGNGWYTDMKYQLSKKLQMLGRLDVFNPDVNLGSDSTTEYTLGSNYLFNDYLLFMINYTYADRKAGKESNRLGLMTQVVF